MEISQVVMSCRVRLARNISGYPFTGRLSEKQAYELRLAAASALEGCHVRCIKDLSPTERTLLIEKHLASMELAESPAGALITGENDTLSVMVNEEDHLRIQGILPQLDLPGAYAICKRADERLSGRLPYAYDSRFGYLTACPTNLGTGMRASAMLHLAGLSLSGQLEPLLRSLAKLGVAVRGFYGESSAAPGSIYQISNQFTLGMQEEDIISALTDISAKLARQEMQARAALLQNSPTELSDRIGRSIGICGYAVKMAFEEFMQHISNIKLGVSMGLAEGITMAEADELIVSCQRASLSKTAGKELDTQQENIARAERLRVALKEI